MTRSILALGIMPLLALAAAAPAAAQETLPVEIVFEQWLAAFNSGDPEAVVDFYQAKTENPSAMFLRDHAENTCGFDPVRIESREERSMNVLLAERCFPALHRLEIALGADDAGKLERLVVRPFAQPMDMAANALAALAGRLSRNEDFAGSLLLEQGGKELLAQSWGTLELGGGSPITLDTPFFYGSAGKMFTAVAVLQLVERGLVDLDAPMGTYLADYPNAEMAQVTVRQLLQHRGGTGDIGVLGRDEGENRERVKTIADIIVLNGDRPPAFEPGTQAEYSNFGMVLLGAIVEAVSGQDYYGYVQEHIFDPVGMDNAAYPDLDHLEGVAMGYTTFYGEEEELHSSLEVLPWRGSPAGGGVASARDFMKFMTALREGRLLSPDMLRLATTPGDTPWYGMGFIISADPYRFWGHGGQAHGNDVAVYYYADFDTTFICTASRDLACTRLINDWWLRVSGLAE